MNRLQAQSEQLASLETFEPAVFRGDADVPQAVCDFVLALAVVYNDLKDVIFALLLVGESRPAKAGRNRVAGAWSGIEDHVFRAMAALLYALFELINKNQKQIQHPYFVSLATNDLKPRTRRAWKSVIAAADTDHPADPFGKQLVALRHNVLSHYGPKAIRLGYATHFFTATPSDTRAYISRGANMRTSRFYFADAATVGYTLSLVGKPGIEKLRLGSADVLQEVNWALFNIVEAFIERRGGFRPEEDQFTEWGRAHRELDIKRGSPRTGPR